MKPQVLRQSNAIKDSYKSNIYKKYSATVSVVKPRNKIENNNKKSIRKAVASNF